MSADTTQMMQDALQAAVTRLNGNGSSEPRAAPPDTIGTLLSFVPKLLQNNEAGGRMLDKLEALQKGDLTSLRGDVQILRKQCFRVFKSQEQLLTKLSELEKQQAAIGHAVLELANQLARITFVDDAEDESEDAPPGRDQERSDSRNNRTATRQEGRDKRRQSTAARAERGGPHDR